MLAGAWALAGACALVAAVLWSNRPALAAVAVLGLLAALGERQSVVLDRRAHETVSLGGSFIILAGIIGGPLGGALVGLLAMAGDTAPPWPRRITFTGVQIALGAAAGTAASWVGPTDGDAARIVLAVLAGTLAGVLVNVLSVTSIDVALRAPSSTYRFRGPLLLIASSLVWLPVPVAVAFGYDAIGVPLLLLAGTPMVVVALVRRLRDERERLGATLLSERAGSAISLVRSLDARDRYTAKHSAGVAVYAGDLAARLGLEAEAVRRLRVCGLLHDIGKIAVPVEVLHKRGALDAAELAIIREHPLVGESILRDAPGAASILPAVRHHHERPDGAGYPGRPRRQRHPGRGGDRRRRRLLGDDARPPAPRRLPARGGHRRAATRRRRAVGRRDRRRPLRPARGGVGGLPPRSRPRLRLRDDLRRAARQRAPARPPPRARAGDGAVATPARSALRRRGGNRHGPVDRFPGNLVTKGNRNPCLIPRRSCR